MVSVLYHPRYLNPVDSRVRGTLELHSNDVS